MIPTLVARLALLALTTAAHSDTASSPPAGTHATVFAHARWDSRFPHSVAPKSVPHVLACCTVCSVGKDWGNTCISRDKTCHVGPGCACDG